MKKFLPVRQKTTLIYIALITTMLCLIRLEITHAEDGQHEILLTQEINPSQKKKKQKLQEEGKQKRDPSKKTLPAKPHIHEELQQIKAWLESIERDSERRPIVSEEGIVDDLAYPLQTSTKTHLSGGLTFIAQGIQNNRPQFGGDGGDGSLSIDLIFESEIRENGLLIVRGDFMRGEGLTRLPPLAAGVNADIETFIGGPDSFHLIEALYEQTWGKERYRFAFGQIDTTSYFDLNEFANSETFQFISPLFGNNPAINWGGDQNGYGPGFAFHIHPIEAIEFNLGVFEGDGNYIDLFDQPFIIAEIELEYHGENLEGHYRFIFWSNETNRAEIINPTVSASHNRGFAISFDHELTKALGLWTRFGMQDGKVSEFDRHASVGLQIKNPFKRSDDFIGIALGKTWVSDENKRENGLDKNEITAEIYYNFKVAQGIHLSPDIQHIINPGGNGLIDPITVYGIRTQLVF